MRILSSLAALCCAALLFTATASAADGLYWGSYSNSTIERAGLAGEGGGKVFGEASGVENPYGTAIDAAAGKVYWINLFEKTIGYANLDGSEPQVLNTTGAPITSPTGLAIDPAAGRLYWVNETGGVSYANLDGSGGGALNTSGASFARAFGIAVDPSLGRLYWANFESSTISWANLNGSGGGTLTITPTLPEGPDGLAIDAAQGRLYWANYEGSTIGYADIDGESSGLLDVGGAPVEEPAGIAIDPLAEKIYWANEEGASIGVASLTGTGGTALATSTGEAPNFPVLLEKPAATPVIETAQSNIYPDGTILTCTTRTWEPDLVESFLYRAPQTISYAWLRNGAPIVGASAASLIAKEPGHYACQVTATNGAGSNTVGGGSFEVEQPITVRLVPVATVQLTKVKFDRRHGTATVLAQVSGPGEVSLSGKGVAARNVRSAGAGVAKLKVAAKGKALKALRRAGKVKMRITVEFAPSEGAVVKASRALVLHRKPR